jgi:hypothetical protein
MLSDFLAPSLGTESLRYAMLYALPPVMTWSAVHYWLAAKSIRQDIANAPS